MQVVAVPSPSRAIAPHRAALAKHAACCGALTLILPLACRAAATPIPPDPQTISALEVRAHDAPAREQVQLYADVVDKFSTLAIRQIADGENERAEETLKRLEACSAIIESNILRDSKGLKRTELLLHATNRRLADLVRSASGDMKPLVQSALRHLDKAQTALLGAIFEK